MATVLRFVPLAALATLAAGCPKSTPSASPAPSASAAASSGTVVAPPPSSSSALTVMGKMAHCPSTVDAAKTIINDVEGGVELVVTGPNADATQQIRERAKFLSEASKATSTAVKHTGHGEGGGVFGRCPVVMRNTTVDAVDIDSGSKLTVKPETAAELDWLRRETRERYADLSAPGAAGAGAGKMSNCPSAVPGSITLIKDTHEGFDVVVTAKDEAASAEIRKRAKHLVDVAKVEAVTIQHTGGGTGGGGLGRCPVVLEDTLLAEKDIPGGAAVSVKAQKPEDLGAIRREAQDRVVKFAGMAAK